MVIPKMTLCTAHLPSQTISARFIHAAKIDSERRTIATLAIASFKVTIFFDTTLRLAEKTALEHRYAKAWRATYRGTRGASTFFLGIPFVVDRFTPLWHVLFSLGVTQEEGPTCGTCLCFDREKRCSTPPLLSTVKSKFVYPHIPLSRTILSTKTPKNTVALRSIVYTPPALLLSPFATKDVS